MRRRLLKLATAAALCGCALVTVVALGALIYRQTYVATLTWHNGRDSVTFERSGQRVGVKVTWDGEEAPHHGWLYKRYKSVGQSWDLVHVRFFDYDITVGGYREKAWGWRGAGVEYRRHSIYAW